MTEILSVKRLRKRIGKQWILKEVSFSVSTGFVHLLLGPNGAGKTTTIKCILGLHRKYTGSIKLGISRDRIGYVPEVPYELQGYTVKDLVELVARKIGKDLREARSYLELLDTDHLLDRKFSSLSKGQRKRVYMSLALIREPKLLVLDEPFAGVDVEHVIRFKELMHKLKKEKVTMLVSSHILMELEDIVDRVTIIYSGKSIKTLDREQIEKLTGEFSYLLDVVLEQANASEFINDLKSVASIDSVERERNKLKIKFRIDKSNLTKFYRILVLHKPVVIRLSLAESNLYELYLKEKRLFEEKSRENES